MPIHSRPPRMLHPGLIVALVLVTASGLATGVTAAAPAAGSHVGYRIERLIAGSLRGQPSDAIAASGGVEANAGSNEASISADGRFVAFRSYAGNLVPADTNGVDDIFVRDRQTGRTTRVSVSSRGAQGNLGSSDPSISADGRFVAFESIASNLVPGDTNGESDVFVHDRRTGRTTRVSVASGGAQGTDESLDPSIGADGRYVAFQSHATNLVPGDMNRVPDIFVHDRRTGLTTRVSIASGGTQGNDLSDSPSISGDGRFVAFSSTADNLVPRDTNGTADVFVRDRQTRRTTRVSVASSGAQGDSASFEPSISGDGRFVAFYSLASNLVAGDTNAVPDVFVHDRRTGRTTRVSVASRGAQGDSGSQNPSISADGRFVTFESGANNLVPRDTNGSQDIFVHDRQTRRTTRVSVASDGAQGSYTSDSPSISGDGRLVAFSSIAVNLVPRDMNGVSDVFVRDRQSGRTTRISVPFR